MSFSGLPAIVAQMERLGGASKLTADELKKLAEAAMKAVTEGEKATKKGEEVLTKAQRTAKEVDRLNKEFAKSGAPMHAEAGSELVGYPWPVWGELLTPEQKIAQGAGVGPSAAGNAVATAFKAMADRIDKWQGDNTNYWSQLLNKEIPYLQKGATSAQGAQDLVAAIVNHMLPGIMQELANPKTPIEMRSILQQLLQFALSGQMKIDNLAKVYADNSASMKEIEKATKGIQDRQDAANKFAEDIGKGVQRIEKEVKSGEATTNAIELFSKDLERQIGALGFSSGGSR